MHFKPWSGIVKFSLLSFLIGTGFARATPGADQSAAEQLQQQKSDLLAGVQRGVCYSGFRHGQHPDRGVGAVNPSDKEMLEDLQLLARNGNFGLIRLYDSDENSKGVLRVIQ